MNAVVICKALDSYQVAGEQSRKSAGRNRESVDDHKKI
jgi:hypothetical protein